MPRISGDVNISAELRIAQPNGRSTPIREWDVELSSKSLEVGKWDGKRSELRPSLSLSSTDAPFALAKSLSAEDDTYICTTWIDLDSLDADPVEYL